MGSVTRIARAAQIDHRVVVDALAISSPKRMFAVVHTFTSHLRSTSTLVCQAAKEVAVLPEPRFLSTIKRKGEHLGTHFCTRHGVCYSLPADARVSEDG